MRRNKVSFQSLTTREGQERLSDVMKVSDNFENQFEIPVLFYALLVTLMFTYHSDATYLICAWLFVLTRAIHAIIHCTVNNVALRFTAHFLGSAILGAMWVRFAIQVLWLTVKGSECLNIGCAQTKADLVTVDFGVHRELFAGFSIRFAFGFR